MPRVRSFWPRRKSAAPFPFCDEPLRCVASWYDVEATLAGPGEQGKLVRDVNMTLWDCGPDGTCANSDDTRYNGNYFSEDANFDGVIDVAERPRPDVGSPRHRSGLRRRRRGLRWRPPARPLRHQLRP